MKIFVDENIPKVTVDALRSARHDVLDIRGTSQQGMFDDELWPLAQKERRMWITTDKGFIEYRDQQHYGCLIVRLCQPNEQRLHSRVMAAFEQFFEGRLARAFGCDARCRAERPSSSVAVTGHS